MTNRVIYSGVLLFVAVAAVAAIHSTVRATGDAAARTTPEDSTRLACDLAQLIAIVSPGTSIQRGTGVFTHESLPEPVRGCRLMITGSFQGSPPGEDAVNRLRDGFTARGWQEMPAYSADGKDGTAFALRKADVACLFRGTWSGGSDGEPSMPREDTYRVSVLCTSPAPPEERTRQS